MGFICIDDCTWTHLTADVNFILEQKSRPSATQLLMMLQNCADTPARHSSCTFQSDRLTLADSMSWAGDGIFHTTLYQLLSRDHSVPGIVKRCYSKVCVYHAQDLEDKVSGQALHTAETNLAAAQHEVTQLQSQLHQAQTRATAMSHAEAQVPQLREQLQHQQAATEEQATAVAALSGGFDRERVSWQEERSSLLSRTKVSNTLLSHMVCMYILQAMHSTWHVTFPISTRAAFHRMDSLSQPFENPVSRATSTAARCVSILSIAFFLLLVILSNNAW